MPESRDPSVPGLDRPGLVLSVAMLVTLDLHDHRGARATAGRRAATLGGFAVAAAAAGRLRALGAAYAAPDARRHAVPDRRFSAASGAVTITFFALFGFIFLVTQYFQFVRGYGTLSTGARILPVALSIAVASVVGAALAPRIGTKIVVTTGLVLFGAAFLWISTVGASTRRTPT